MAENKKNKPKVDKIRAVFGDKVADKLGTFKESTGGGTPIPKGEKLKDHPEAKRVSQPRDEEGKFTYNAVNEKPLKYGPSRGETPVPIFDNVDLSQFVKKGEVTVVDGDKRYKVVLNQSLEELMNNFRHYSKKRGFGEWSKEVGTKKGRWSKDERTSQNLSKRMGGPVVVNKEKVEERFTKKEEKPESKEKETPKQENTTPTKNTDSNETTKTDLKQTAESNKDLIGEMMKVMPSLTPTQAATIVASGKVKNIDDFKKIIGA